MWMLMRVMIMMRLMEQLRGDGGSDASDTPSRQWRSAVCAHFSRGVRACWGVVRVVRRAHEMTAVRSQV